MESGPGQPPLSKNQQKKRAKAERLQAVKSLKKQAEKAKKKQDTAARQADLKVKLGEMSEQERAEWAARRKEVRQERQQQGKSRKEALQQALQTGQRLIIDLDFQDFMSDSELKSLCKQVVYCWSANLKAEKPCHMVLASYQGAVQQQLQQQAPDMGNWILTTDARGLAELAKDQTLVYLTADAEEELTSMSADEAYVIGGLVDRNRHKNLCKDRAKDLGIRCAKLPIGQHVALTGSAILTVNHVFAIMLAYMQTGSWKDAFAAAIPERKRDQGKVNKPEPDAKPVPTPGSTLEPLTQTSAEGQEKES